MRGQHSVREWQFLSLEFLKAQSLDLKTLRLNLKLKIWQSYLDLDLT
jgi:hypothetical protein